MTRYKIIIDDADINVICEALNLLMRVGMGQIEEVMDYTPDIKGLPPTIRPQLRSLGSQLGGFSSPGVYHSIHSPAVPLNSKRAYDLFRVFKGNRKQELYLFTSKELPDMEVINSLEYLLDKIPDGAKE